MSCEHGNDPRQSSRESTKAPEAPRLWARGAKGRHLQFLVWIGRCGCQWTSWTVGDRRYTPPGHLLQVGLSDLAIHDPRKVGAGHATSAL